MQRLQLLYLRDISISETIQLPDIIHHIVYSLNLAVGIFLMNYKRITRKLSELLASCLLAREMLLTEVINSW